MHHLFLGACCWLCSFRTIYWLVSLWTIDISACTSLPCSKHSLVPPFNFLWVSILRADTSKTTQLSALLLSLCKLSQLSALRFWPCFGEHRCVCVCAQTCMCVHTCRRRGWFQSDPWPAVTDRLNRAALPLSLALVSSFSPLFPDW